MTSGKSHETFRPKIRRYLGRLVGEVDAEYLTQEVFEKVSRVLRSFRGESSVATWIYRIAANAALDRLRNPSFRRRLQEASLEDPVAYDRLAPDGTEGCEHRLHRARAKLKHDLQAHCDSSWIEDNQFIPDLRTSLADRTAGPSDR